MRAPGPRFRLWILVSLVLAGCLIAPATQATGFLVAIRRTLELDSAYRSGDAQRLADAARAAAPLAPWVVDICWRQALVEPGETDPRDVIPSFLDVVAEHEPEAARGAREVDRFYRELPDDSRDDLMGLDESLRRGWTIAVSRREGPAVVEVGREVARRARELGHPHARAEAEYLLGIGHLQQTDLDAAREHLERCHELALAAGDRWMAYISSVEQGDGEYHFGLAKEARAAYSRARALEAGFPLTARMYCLIGLASTHALLGEEDASTRVFREAWELCTAPDAEPIPAPQILEVGGHLLENLVVQGRAEEALAIGEEATRHYDGSKPEVYYKLQAQIGGALFESGRIAAGLKLAAGAVEALEGIGDENLADFARQTLARMYVDAGYLHAALFHLHHIERGFADRPTHPVLRGRVHRDLGYVYEAIDRNDRAREHYRVALAAAEEAGSTGLIESARRHLSDIVREEGDPQELESTLEWLRRDLDELGTLQRSLRYGVIGRILDRLGRDEEAVEALRKGEGLAGDSYNRVRARLNVVAALLDLERWDESETALKELAGEEAVASTPYIAARIDELRSRLHQGRGEIVPAIEAAERVTARWELLRQDLSRERDRQAFQGRVGRMAERILALCFDHREVAPGAIGRAFEAAERTRARTLLDGLREGFAPGTDPREISEALTAVTEARRRLQRDVASSEARAELEQAEAALARAHEGEPVEPGRFRGVRPVTLTEARELARELDVELVQYFVGSQRAFVFRIAPSGEVTLDELPSPAELRAAVGSLRASLRDIRAFRDLFEESARLLGRALLPGGKRHDRIVVLPDGPLHRVPFDLLVMTSEGEEQYWLEALTVSLAPSVSTQVALLESAGKAVSVAVRPWVLVGQPAYSGGATDSARARTALREPRELEHADRELEAIAEALAGEPVRRLSGERVTEQAMRALLPAARAIHFVGHGHLDELSALMSGLLVTPSEEDDGLLTVAEVERLELNADLVVLSACSTGEGHPERWEGLVGLTRAFLQAGARRVVSSISGVEDETTARLMAKLYREVARGRSVDEALRDAKLSILRSAEETASPLSWASFTLFGLPR